MTTSAPRTARARVRAELTSEITAVARRHLAESGAAALSLRAVARELSMASSAVYRYFPSRDDLLTTLIVEAYTSLADAAQEADAGKRRTDTLGRWIAVTEAARAWAVERPHEYALVYGSPVPGYRAPEATVDPGVRLPLLLLRIVADAAAPMEQNAAPAYSRLTPGVRADLDRLRKAAGIAIDDAALLRALGAYAELVGLLNLELFGHLRGGVEDDAGHFAAQTRRIAAELGLTRR